MPIVNGKYVNPGWVNNSPPALSASEMNAISDTLEQLSQGGGGSGGGTAIPCVLIGTSAGGADTSMCQYVCTGTHDEVTIAQADQYAVGKKLPLFFMPGTYNLDNTLTINSNTYGWNSPQNIVSGYPVTFNRRNLSVQKAVIFNGTEISGIGFGIAQEVSSVTPGNIELSVEGDNSFKIIRNISFNDIMGTGLSINTSGSVQSRIFNVKTFNFNEGVVGISLDGQYSAGDFCGLYGCDINEPVNLNMSYNAGAFFYIQNNNLGALNLVDCTGINVSGNQISTLSISKQTTASSNVLISNNGIKSSITVGDGCNKIYILSNIGTDGAPASIVDNSSGGVTVANNYNFSS